MEKDTEVNVRPRQNCEQRTFNPNRKVVKKVKDQLEVKLLEVEELEERIAPGGFGPSNNGNPATRSRTAQAHPLGMATDATTPALEGGHRACSGAFSLPGKNV